MRMIAAFFDCFQGLRRWREVCLRLQLHFRNVSGGAVVTVMAGQRPLATAHCSHSYCSLDRSVFFCSANFAKAAGESNEMARRMSACRARQGCTALLSGNIGESAASEDFSLVRTAHPRTVHPADFWSLKAPPRDRAQGRKIKNLSPLQGKPGLFAMPTLDRANGQ